MRDSCNYAPRRVSHMPHCDVTLQAAAGKAAVGVAPHEGVHTLGVVGASVGDALPADNTQSTSTH
jgi:hypothetical protein